MISTNTLTLTTILSLLATTNAVSTQNVINNCPTVLYLTNVNSNKTTTGPFPIPSAGGEWSTPIVGTGNSLGVTKNDRFWTPETPKLIMGTSTDKGILYWTVSKVDGDPFEGQKWAVDSGEANACDGATLYEDKVHGCQDNDITLTLTLC